MTDMQVCMRQTKDSKERQRDRMRDRGRVGEIKRELEGVPASNKTVYILII